MLRIEDYPEIQETCRKFRIVPDFKLLSYVPVPSIIQSGPQCGIVAVAMVAMTQCSTASRDILVNEIFKYALNKKMTQNGELFSARWMQEIVQNSIENLKKIELFEGEISSENFVKFMLNNGIALVPYDADGNHSPCSKQGHKAHWAVVHGLAEINDNYHVIARHGKSKNVAIWSLESLSTSNGQLIQFSPQRESSNLNYVLPEGGIGGVNGLKNKSILIYF